MSFKRAPLEEEKGKKQKGKQTQDVTEVKACAWANMDPLWTPGTKQFTVRAKIEDFPEEVK